MPGPSVLNPNEPPLLCSPELLANVSANTSLLPTSPQMHSKLSPKKVLNEKSCCKKNPNNSMERLKHLSLSKSISGLGLPMERGL